MFRWSLREAAESSVVTILCDGYGNRVAKTVGGATTRCLIDDIKNDRGETTFIAYNELSQPQRDQPNPLGLCKRVTLHGDLDDIDDPRTTSESLLNQDQAVRSALSPDDLD
jgi:hypothetical protein